MSEILTTPEGESDFVLETKDEPRFAPSKFVSTDDQWEPDLDLVSDFETIPDKMAFKIGEVADLLGIKTYVLRYWESEFEALKPEKSKHNQRVYSRRDVEMAFMIKKLLYKDRFSIEGARTALKKLKKESKKVKVLSNMNSHYEDLRNQVTDILMDIRRMKDRLI